MDDSIVAVWEAESVNSLNVWSGKVVNSYKDADDNVVSLSIH